MKTYLVTGGAGFIGSHLVDALLSKGGRVRILDNLSSGSMKNLPHMEDRIEFIKGDIRNRDQVRETMKGVEVVFHEAALRSVPKSIEYPTDYHDVNATGLINLLEESMKQKIQKFIFASSSACYGNVTEFPQREDKGSHPISPYAQTKMTGEDYCRLFSIVYRLPTVSLRYFNVFGPRQPVDDEYSAVIPKFISCLLKGEPPPIFGDGEQSRDFTYVGNVVDANLAACKAKVGSGEVINVACGTPVTILTLALKVASVLGKTEVGPRHFPPRNGDVRKSHADIGRLKNLLGVTPRVSFDEGLKETIRWFQEHYRHG